MEFPGTKFTKKFRLIYFILVVLLFFIITPLTILYTAGYRYDFSNGVVKVTGGISIDIKPKASSIYIDDILIKQEMPIRLKNVTPKKYTIRIDAGENYYLWEKEIEVKEKQTIYIKEINLIKKNTPQLFKTGDITKQKISKDGKYLSYILINNNLPEVWIYNLENNEDKIIMRLDINEDFNLNWDEKNDYLIISQNKVPTEKLYVVNAKTTDKIIDLTKKIKEPIDKFVWNNSVEPEIFYSTPDLIYSFKPNTETVYEMTKNNFIDWYMENGKLWTLQYDTDLKTYKIIQDTIGFSNDFAVLNDKKYDNYKIAVAVNNHILIKNIQKPEMTLLTKNENFNLAGEKFYISPFNNWWLIWTPWELRTYSEGEEPQLINRSGEQLENVVPLDEYNTLCLVWGNKTSVLFPYYLVGHDFIAGQINNVEVDSKNKTLYFTAKQDDEKGIYKLNY